MLWLLRTIEYQTSSLNHLGGMVKVREAELGTENPSWGCLTRRIGKLVRVASATTRGGLCVSHHGASEKLL